MKNPAFAHQNISRRSFLKMACAGTAGLSVLNISKMAQAKQAKRPNILFIVTDDQEFNQFNFLPEGRDAQGKARNLTPNIDRLANEGVVLENLHCPSPLCVPARFIYLTGLYASRATNQWMTDLHKLFGCTYVHQEPNITADTPTLAKYLKNMGYTTGIVGKNHAIEAAGYNRLSAEDPFDDPKIQERIKTNAELVHRACHKAGFDFAERIYYTNPRASGPAPINCHNLEWITEGALNFIDANKDKPFYLYYATTVPHAPRPCWKGDPLATPEGMLSKAPQVMPPRETLTERVKKAGLPADRADILWLDDGVGALIKKLEQHKILEDTIIFYVNDHGVESGKTTIYQGGMHTIGFVRAAKKYIKQHRFVKTLTSTVDLVPTVYSFCGGKGGDALFDGVDLTFLLQGKKQKVRDSVYGEIGHTRAVRMGKWKYLALRYAPYVQNMEPWERKLWEDAWDDYFISTGREAFHNDPNRPFGHAGYTPGGEDNQWPAMEKYPAYFDADQLYDLSKDPDEQHNLAYDPAYKQVLDKMKAELKKYLDRLPGNYAEFKQSEPAPDVSKEEKAAIAERLRKTIFH
jgi:arylsulfatase A-like enzyme